MTAHTFWVIVYCLGLVVFVNRYLGGMILRKVRGDHFDETIDDYEPTVTAVIPMFNEGVAIRETLQSLLDANYPAAKLKIICVDDCSTDDSYELAREFAKKTGGRLKVIRNRVNMGKRRSIISAVRQTDSEIIVSVDSDVVVDTEAIRQLVRRFVSDQIAAVGGWVDVRNKKQNWLTRMQVVKYWYGYNFLKNIEWGFRRVMCLSGCLTAYRRSVLVELEPVLEERAILGVPIKYGEDRFLTRQIVKAGYLTTMTLDAKCRTFVPSSLASYFSQQLRWRRSNIVDYTGAFSHVWRLNPILAIHFFSQMALLMIYPIAVIRALMSGWFFSAIVYHVCIMALMGLYYRWRVRKLAPEERVGVLAFCPLVLLMPITYAMLTPLALFTLDTANWETRNHEEADAVPDPVRDVASSEILVGESALAAITETSRRARSHAQMPAA
jgi:cellulose synthase/poly-beta-1,6-N-acetylglucosamine synthase-like glycosyltransferase